MSLQMDAIYERSSYREQCQVDATHMCRICAEFSDGLVNVFSKNGAKMDLINKIHTHLPIEITLRDVLPLVCCNRCIEQLNACHELVNRCLEADWKLRSLLQGDDKHQTEYSKGNSVVLENLNKGDASPSLSFPARNDTSSTDHHLMHTTKTYTRSTVLEGLKRKSAALGLVDALQRDKPSSRPIPKAAEVSMTHSAHLSEVKKEDWMQPYMAKRKCGGSSTLPDKEKSQNTLTALSVKQKQKEAQKYKVVLVKLKNSASLSKAVQVEKALQMVKTKQEAGDLPEAKGPVPKRLQKKLKGLKTYGLLKPNKCIRLPLETRDCQTEDTSNTSSAPHNTDYFLCSSCEKMFIDLDALNTHVASSHKDLLFCYCSQTFKTQTQLNEHLEMHVSEDIESKSLKSRATEENECEALKSHATEENESEALKSRATEENESEALKSHTTEENESEALKSRATEEIEVEPLKSCVMEEIESEPLRSDVMEEVESKPLISQIVENIPLQSPKHWIKKMGDTSSLLRQNVAKTSIDMRSSPLTKERILLDQRENVRTPVSDSLMYLNTGRNNNDRATRFENRTLSERKYIDLTEGNSMVIKCENHVAFSSLDESRVLMDSIIASVPKTKTKIWRCPMCGLVYPGEDRWLKHCEGIHFRCHFCMVVLGSVLEQKQHETEHLRVTICSKPSCFT